MRNRLHGFMLCARALRIRLLAAAGCLQLGRRLRAGRNVELVVYGDLSIGDDVLLDDGCKLQVGPGATLRIGDFVYVGRGSVIAAAERIEIGSHTLIAEHCSVRDGDHQLDPAARRQETSAVTGPVVIESDVWIAAGSRVLRGSRLSEGAVVGANSVVRGVVPARTVVAGAPARAVKRV